MRLKKTKFLKGDWILIILASFTGVSFFFFAQYSAIKMIGPFLPALLICLIAPVVIVILALVFFKENLTLIKILGFIIATLGGFLLKSGGNLKELTLEDPDLIGYLFALITPFLWAIYSTLTEKTAKSSSDIVILKYNAYFGTFELLIFVIINNELFFFVSNSFNVILILCALYIGILCYILGYFIWQNSQSNLKSSKVTSFLYAEPFLTLIFSILLQRSETIVGWNIIGGIIVQVAVLTINYK
ncbi:MAG: DMT family transporter [Candidatus Thorarchaeota archaeon]